MAVAAAEQQTHEFNWDIADAEFTRTMNYDRLPASEIYGRSLSTIYRLGAYMVEKAVAEATHSPEADQARVEFYTSVEEGFGTDLELGGGLEVRDFDKRPVINGRVMSKDLKTAVSGMTHAGLICAEEKVAKESAKGDESFLPQLIRSKWDHENAVIVDQMARGETNYNTRIVISPFPEEAAAKSGAAYWQNIGYVPHLKRGFVQLYYVNEEGEEALAGSLSFDGSNKWRLIEVFQRRDIKIPDTEVTDNWLKYAITDNLTEEQAKALALEIADQAGDSAYKKTENTVDVTHEHRVIIDKVFNESYVHACESLARGYQTEGARKLILQLADKASDFNEHYEKALYEMRANEHQFTDEDMIVLHELLVYSTIEMMRAFHIDKIDVADGGAGMHGPGMLDAMYLEILHSQNPEALQNALSNFAAQGARSNRTYSACGLSISLGDPTNPDSPQSAYGGYESSRKKVMTCPHCSAKVFDDPCATVLACNDCRALVINGHTKSKGNGGTAAREAKKKAEKQRREAELAQQIDEIYKARGLSEDVLDKLPGHAPQESNQLAKVQAST
ncbi:MAG: hypothetical protein JWL89_305 [Candidatus Saccharibacteria bacterium]|nr:hypothetical protein [Candidatus Saccharibacteria bacterium]